jgi:hypothetical protein
MLWRGTRRPQPPLQEQANEASARLSCAIGCLAFFFEVTSPEKARKHLEKKTSHGSRAVKRRFQDQGLPHPVALPNQANSRCK